MLEHTIGALTRGIVVDGYTIKAQRVKGARFREEHNFRLHASIRGQLDHLCYVKIFTGRPPFYRPWIELFDLYGSVHIGENRLDYFGSSLEYGVLRFFASMLEPGENIFVEYLRDRETKKQLEAGVPASICRLGNLLYGMGFTWFKDWYFPEGFLEGEQKLQAEKPLDEKENERQKATIVKELKIFLKTRDTQHRTVYYPAYDRAAEILHTSQIDAGKPHPDNTNSI